MGKFGWDLVKGLKYIHELGIILSDLNPAKVWIPLGLKKIKINMYIMYHNNKYDGIVVLYYERITQLSLQCLDSPGWKSQSEV